jgi:hypothetical protein
MSIYTCEDSTSPSFLRGSDAQQEYVYKKTLDISLEHQGAAAEEEPWTVSLSTLNHPFMLHFMINSSDSSCLCPENLTVREIE